MATTKKRRPVSDSGDEARPPSQCRAGEEATDDEIEQFFAIIRQMRDTARLLAQRGGGGEKKVDEERQRQIQCSSRWRPAFEREDFTAAGYAKDAGQTNEGSTAAPEESCEDRSRSREAAAIEEADETGMEKRIPGRSLDLNAEPSSEE